MNKQREKIEAEKSIFFLLKKAGKKSEKDPSLAKELIRKARRKAMHFNIKLQREIRRKFCRKCLVYFTSKNCSIRVKRGFIVLKCLNCNTISRYKAI
jgi:ribonuclease P protein subunit RPR2